MEQKEQYIEVMNEIISRQVIILGPEIAVLKARNVSGIVVSDDGKVADIKSSPSEAARELIDEYVKLSGQIVKSALGPIFTKYPTIKNEIEKIESLA